MLRALPNQCCMYDPGPWAKKQQGSWTDALISQNLCGSASITYRLLQSGQAAQHSSPYTYTADKTCFALIARGEQPAGELTHLCSMPDSGGHELPQKENARGGTDLETLPCLLQPPQLCPLLQACMDSISIMQRPVRLWNSIEIPHRLRSGMETMAFCEYPSSYVEKQEGLQTSLIT